MKKILLSVLFLLLIFTVSGCDLSSGGNGNVEPEIPVEPEKPEMPIKLTVTFNVNGGSSVTAIEVEEGQRVNKPTDPTRSGYMFEGWYVDQELTTKFDFNNPITANTTLYAKWIEVVQPVPTYSVTYVTEHGQAPAAVNDVTALPATLPELETEGYTFVGWYLDQACTTIATAGASITENTTLYAKWEKVPSGPTLLSHIKELAENVDKTPEFSIREDITTLSARGRRNKISDNTTEVDITNPENNENYQEYIMADRYFWGTEHTNIKNANIFIEYVKSVKEELISCVTMLDTWIYDINTNCKYRIRYDQINDIVYLEKISDGSLYIRISSSYVNNKMVIDTYQYQVYNESSGVEVSVHYEEDKVLYYYEKAEFGAEENLFMLTSDLSIANPINVCLSYSSLDQGDRISYQMFKYVYKMGTETESGLDIYNSYLLDGLINEYSNDFNTVIINNSNEDFVFSFQDGEHSYFFDIDLYELTGYDKIIRGDNHYKIVVGDRIFKSENSNGHGFENSIVYETGDYSIIAYVVEHGTCQLHVNVDIYNEELTPSRALTEFLEYLDLSFKDETITDKFLLLDNSDEVLGQYKYFDYSSAHLVTLEEMEQIYEINKLPSVKYPEIMEMLNAEHVDINEQIEDANYYQLYSNGVSGEVSYNSDNTFNLSDLSISLSETGILTTGAEYSLVAYLSNGYDVYFLDKQTITYEGKTVTINLNNNVQLPSDLTIGKYHIIVYLATQIDTQEIRVSSIYTATATENFDYLTTIEKEGVSYLVRAISNDEFIIAMDEMFELKGQVQYIEETKYLNLSSIAGSLSNGYILLESDLVTLNATFYNADNEAVHVIEDKFYFGSSSLSAVVDMQEFPELAEGNYQLKINFEVVDKNNNVIYSENYKHIDTFKALIIEEQRLDIDALIIEAFEEYIEFKYVKVLDVNLNISYENDIIDMSNSNLEILYPEFFENQDTVFIDICFRCDDEEVAPLYFSVFSTYDLLESEFVFPTIDLTSYSVEGGLYKVEYQVIVSNNDGSTKMDKKYETELEFDIEAITTDNVVEETE